MQTFKKRNLKSFIFAIALAVTLTAPMAIAGGSNNNSGTGFDSPDLKIKEFREKQ
ncbi:MAG: hypothetical protein ACE5G9_08795 [Nitrospinales bacterium]